MEVKEIYNKIGAFIKASFSAEEIKSLKDNKVKLEGELAAPAPVKMTDVKTQDGKMLSVEGEMAVGSMISLIDEAGIKTPAEGEFMLEDGTKVEAMAGKITAVESAEMPAPAPMIDATKMEAQFSKAKEDFETKLSAIETKHKAEIDELKKVTLSALNAFDKIAEKLFTEPVITVDLSKQIVDESKLSAAQKYRISKGLPA